MVKTMILNLARRYASQIGLWGLLASVIAGLFGVETEAVRELIGQIQSGEKTLIGGILAGVVTWISWRVEKEKEQAKEEGREQGQVEAKSGVAKVPDDDIPVVRAGADDDPGIVQRVRDFFDRDEREPKL